VRVGLRVSDADWLPIVLDRVPGPFRVSRSGVVDRVFSFQAGGAQPGTAIRRFHLFWSDHIVAARAHDREPIVDAFESTLRALFVKEARGYHFVRAGCVGWRGRAIVVAGFSRAGTSTLVQALVDRGATSYSDAFAVFDRRGRVHAFPTALRLQTSDGAGRRMSHEREACAPLPLGLVVQTAYYEGAEWRPQRLSPAETVLALMPHAARANVEPAAVKSALARAAASAAAIRTPRGDAAETAARILEQVDDETSRAALPERATDSRR
jgi:hypothetical protein